MPRAMPEQPAAAGGGPVSHAIFRVARVHKALAGRLLREIGLYPGQELLMMQLWDSGPQRQVDLMQVVGSDAATMTRMVRRLERAGFVRRTPSEEDRRAVIVEATPASTSLRAQVEQVWSTLEAATVGDLDAAEQDAVLRVLIGLERRVASRSAPGAD